MLKKEIKYEDFNGNQVTEVLYFNISKPELIELEVEYKEGFGGMIQKIVNEQDNKALIQHFKDLVLLAYGEKSDDGKLFVKNDTLRDNFANSAAYQELFMELATDDNAAATFIKGILPRDLSADVDKAMATGEALPKMNQNPPTPPTPPAK